VSVDEYPIVIANTSKAPGMTGGLPTGMSKNRHPTPTAKLIKRPSSNFIAPPPELERSCVIASKGADTAS
jgi:hypothetical protein